MASRRCYETYINQPTLNICPPSPAGWLIDLSAERELIALTLYAFSSSLVANTKVRAWPISTSAQLKRSSYSRRHTWGMHDDKRVHQPLGLKDFGSVVRIPGLITQSPSHHHSHKCQGGTLDATQGPACLKHLTDLEQARLVLARSLLLELIKHTRSPSMIQIGVGFM